MAKKLNHNLVKMHRSYTVADICELYGLHKNTVLQWLKNGLQTIDDHKPAMIQGLVLKSYLKKRSQVSKKKCKVNEVFCMRCKTPVVPAENKVQFIPQKLKTGQLKGSCPCCGGLIFKFCSSNKIEALSKVFDMIIVSDE